MIVVRTIDSTHKSDINIKNEPFKLFGRMVPSYINERWDYDVERFSEEAISEMCFPDENYDYDELAKNSIFVGAYDGEKCIGLAILKHGWRKYMYLYDMALSSAGWIPVCTQAHRRKGKRTFCFIAKGSKTGEVGSIS